MSRILEPSTIEHELAHARQELDLLEQLAAEQRERVHAAEGTPAAQAVRALAERQLEEIRRRIWRAQLSLVHPSDPRYQAAQRMLADVVISGVRGIAA